jgi:isoquinoline 1-oxidoreductase beta subunit
VVNVVRLPYGVAVIADAPWAAFQAKNALNVVWIRNGKAWGHSTEKVMKDFTAIVRDASKTGVAFDKNGDMGGAMKQAVSTLEAEYFCDYAYHAQMEPLNSVASVSPDGKSVEIWCGTQSQSMAVGATATALGIGEDKVKFNGMLMGGGFGRRGHRDEEFVVESVLLSKEVKRPVKLLWTREDDVRNGRFRPFYAQHIRAGLDASGQIVAWHHRMVCDQVTAFQDPERFAKTKPRDIIAMAGGQLSTLAIPNRLYEGLLQDTGVRTSSLRGIGVGPTKFAIEAFLDEYAVRRGIDPVKLRLDLLKNSPRARAVVERVAQMADWGRKREGRGMGFAYIDYTGSQLAGIAEVSIERASGKIRVHNFWCTIDCGIAVQPDNVIAQTDSSTIYGLGLALTELISFKNGVVEQSNFTDYVVMRNRDVPLLHTELIKTDNHPTGAGQMSTPLVAPAISNAVFQLTGVRIRRTPMLPSVVMQAFAEQGIRTV